MGQLWWLTDSSVEGAAALIRSIRWLAAAALEESVQPGSRRTWEQTHCERALPSQCEVLG